jgi:hypothetical protein
MYEGGENACMIFGWKPARKSPYRRPVEGGGEDVIKMRLK